MTNTFNTVNVHQNQAGEFVCALMADGGKLILLVCENEEAAHIMAAHLESMVKRGEVGEVAF